MTFALLAGAIAAAATACLALAFRGRRARAGAPDGRGAVLGRALAALLVPAVATGVYLLVGRPDLAGGPAATGPAQTARLERAAAEEPGSAFAWQRLAAALDEEGRHAEAAEAWLRAVDLPGGDEPDILVQAAGSLILAARGDVPARAEELVRQALDRDPAHLQGRFYAGLALLRAEDPEGALRTWTAVLEDTPGDAPYRPMLEEGIREAAARAGRPVPEAASAPDMERIRAMVDGLAARLAESPDDAAGWKRLGRSRRVLGENEAAYEAYLRAVDLAPGDAEALAGAAEARLTADMADAGGEAAPDEAVGLFRRLLEIDPGHPLGLFVVAEDAARRGDGATARELLGRLLGRLPEGDPAREAVQKRLDALDGNG